MIIAAELTDKSVTYKGNRQRSCSFESPHQLLSPDRCSIDWTETVVELSFDPY